MNEPRLDCAAVEAVDQTAVLVLPAEDSPRRLRLAVAAAAALHALLLIVPLPSLEAEPAEPDQKVYVVLPVQRFKPPEPPPVEPRKERRHRVPVPDPDPTDPEPLRPVDTLEPDFDLPALDLEIDFPAAPPAPDPEPAGPLPIGGPVSAPVRLEGPLPIYPEAARRARIECTVFLQSVIDKGGLVTEIEIEKPCPFGLSEAAVTAVERWRYAPATLKGLPVAVYMNLTVGFKLN